MGWDQCTQPRFFYFSEKNQIQVFIVDENGALFSNTHKHSNYNQIINNYALFIESILNHALYNSDIKLIFYEIQKNTAGHLSIHPFKWKSSKTYLDQPIRIIIEETTHGSFEDNYFIYCNELEFNSFQYHQQLFKAVANYVMDCRSSDDSYPIYITDIEVPCRYFDTEDESQVQMVHYLNYKKKIELKLNL